MLSILLVSTACSGTKTQADTQKDSHNSNIAVCYFSATGTTEKEAQRIESFTGADLIEIVPETAYSEHDLDWRDSTSRSSVEMADSTSRPALKNPNVDLSGYEVVYIGYPNWWNTCPRIINTFIEAANLKGKTVVPFMTSGGSNIINSEKELSEAYPEINWKKGLLMNAVSDNQIREWINTVNE